MGKLSGKVALVTGASRGIGAEIASRLARDGATVFANHPDADAARHAADIAQYAQSLGEGSGNVIPIAANVADAGQVDAMFAAIVERHGGLDIVVNNAGINRDRTVQKMTDAEWRDVLGVNLDGAFFACRAAARHLRNGGRIVSIASVVAHTGNFGVANYAASKAGILGLTRTLSLELAARQITVNAVCPGFIDTAMTQGIRPDVRAAMLQRIPLRRLGSAAEVAGCVCFLASEDAAYITGQSIGVNGGFYMGGA